MVAGAPAAAGGGASGAARLQAAPSNAAMQTRRSRRTIVFILPGSGPRSRERRHCRQSIDGDEGCAVAAAERRIALVAARAVRADLAHQSDVNGSDAANGGDAANGSDAADAAGTERGPACRRPDGEREWRQLVAVERAEALHRVEGAPAAGTRHPRRGGPRRRIGGRDQLAGVMRAELEPGLVFTLAGRADEDRGRRFAPRGA